MTKALILAAGTGSRLMPLTKNKPKGLVKIFGKPIIEYQLEAFENKGIKDISIVTGYHSNKYSKYKLNSFHNEHFDKTNMVSSLFTARSLLETISSKLILSYSDIIFSNENLNNLMASDADIAVMVDLGWKKLWSLRYSDVMFDAESLKINSNFEITEIGQKIKSLKDAKAQYTGLIILSPYGIKTLISVYDSLNKKKKYFGRALDNLYMTDLLQLVINAGFKVSGVPVNHGWLEVDSKEDLEIYEKSISLSKNNYLYDIGS